ncbi:hypothetical protein KVR01_005164 [Diaporthe batatas]|uniref:uncharacterized protein n=1 Tax=Diaporthe batatas TaxID=748121 RepID=UPI001D055884|nr:uncharacterized protein KVR01_005164 [Diaporthe batatas]KAG8164889.1 hypothetical protein KVR01_005164 [Diaporthe batatas]
MGLIQRQTLMHRSWNTSQPGDQDLPNTGVTRNYTFDISRAVLAPDGYEKPMIVINGQYPGPMIEANLGDWIKVTVRNAITEPEEGTAVHWHGFLQRETPWYDGVPSVQQCPIAPGSEFTYLFRADHIGTTFYHSHFSAQISAGVSGPIIIHGDTPPEEDIDLGPVLLSDWFHTQYEEIIEGVMSTNRTLMTPNSNNNLINGKMNFDCSLATDGTPCVSNAGVSKFRFQPGKAHRLRIINGGSAGLQYFSIDEHEMTVISNDWVPIEPYNTTWLTLGVGQRHDVIVYGKTESDADRAYWMRANLSTVCALPLQPYALAGIYYNEEDFDKNTTPSSAAQDFDPSPLNCGNEPLTKTTPRTVVPAVTDPDTTIEIDITYAINATGQQEWRMNDIAFRGNMNHPIMGLLAEGNDSYPHDPQWNVYNTGTNGTVRIIFNNERDASESFAHPMHLHGHDFQVLAQGSGTWDGTITNPSNPLRRDTHILQPLGYLVIQYEANNPGVWPLHCHVAWHVSAGFYINLAEQPDDLQLISTIPEVVDQTCRDWEAWTDAHVVNQIDSGLKEKQRREDMS